MEGYLFSSKNFSVITYYKPKFYINQMTYHRPGVDGLYGDGIYTVSRAQLYFFAISIREMY